VPRRMRVLADAYEVVRAASISVGAILVVACAMAFVGWRPPGLILAAAGAAVAALLVLQVRRAVRHLHTHADQARQGAAEAERHYVEVLRRIVAVVEARDKYCPGHSRNVGELAEKIARGLALPEETCAHLALAGQLHDIGLLAVPAGVLTNHTRLGAAEFRSVQTHSQVSYDVLRPLEMLADVLPAIRSHHERLNGTGYPAGLAGEEIPLGGRILAVADAYDAMTHDRPHRQALSPLVALRELRRCCPSGYDSRCVEALAEAIHAPAMAPLPATTAAAAQVACSR
jgi:HD-GYP domain-containing protein (c-di-GMP phosphodiesterase class II)